MEARTWIYSEGWRNLPLHLACLHSPEPVPLVLFESLIAAHPGAARERNPEGNLPLHLACSCLDLSPRYGLEVEGILMALIECHPEALRMVDGEGRTPLEILEENGWGDRTGSSAGRGAGVIRYMRKQARAAEGGRDCWEHSAHESPHGVRRRTRQVKTQRETTMIEERVEGPPSPPPPRSMQIRLDRDASLSPLSLAPRVNVPGAQAPPSSGYGPVPPLALPPAPAASSGFGFGPPRLVSPADHARASRREEELMAELAKLRAENDQLQTAYTTLYGSHRTTQAEFLEQTNTLARYKTEFDAAKQTWEASSVSLELRLKNAEVCAAEVTRLKTQLLSVTSERDGLRSTVVRLEGELKSERDERGFEKSVRLLQGETISGLEKKVEDLTAVGGALRRETEVRAGERAACERKRADLIEEADNMKRRISELENDLATETADHAATADKLEHQMEANRTLESRIVSIEKEAEAKILQERRMLKSVEEATADELGSRASRTRKLESQLASLKDELRKERAQRAAAQSRLAGQSKKVAGFERAVRVLEDATSSTLSGQFYKSRRMKKAMSALRSELDEERRSGGEARKELEGARKMIADLASRETGQDSRLELEEENTSVFSVSPSGEIP